MLPPVQLPKFLQILGSGTMSQDSCFNSRKPAPRYELGQWEQELFVAQIKNTSTLITDSQPQLYCCFKVTLDYTIVWRLWICVNELNSKTVILKVQEGNKNGWLLLSPGRFYRSQFTVIRSYRWDLIKVPSSLQRCYKPEHIEEKCPHWEKGYVPSVHAIHREPYSLPTEVSECITQLSLCKGTVKAQDFHSKKHLLMANGSTDEKGKKVAHIT